MTELTEFDLETPEILQEEWAYIRDLAADENGFTNDSHGITYADFIGSYILRRRQFLTGEGLESGLVRQTDYILWADGKIAGLFRIRPELNDFLRTQNGGHIGFGIHPDFRGRGYATEGLRQALLLLKAKTRDESAVLFVHKNNGASLRVMQKNGGTIHHETAENYCVHIPLR